MVMIMVNIHEIKRRLSLYVEDALRGEHVVICKRNRPVVEMIAITRKRTEPRPIGGGPYAYDVLDSAFVPLADAEPEEWDGRGVDPGESKRLSRVSGVAKRPDPPYGAGKRKR